MNFGTHDKAKFWNYELNTKTPSEYALNSHHKAWFTCNDCGHDFNKIIKEFKMSKNIGCQFCSKTNKKLCDDNNCDMCRYNSFESIEYSKNWSNKNLVKPRDITKNSHRIKYLFNCPDCKHEFEQEPSHITRTHFNNKYNGNCCIYCAHRKICPRDIDCDFCKNNSFESIDYSIYWNYEKNFPVIPRDVFKSISSQFWFNCHLCNNLFNNKLCHITAGVRCSKCVNKTEKIFYDIIIKLYPSLQQQYKVEWCKIIKYLPFDFIIIEKKIIVELDGEQHFKQVSKWKTPEYNRKHDIFKMKRANKNGFSVIRILQDDIYRNKNKNWINELQENIEKISNDGIVQNIYMCKNNEYEKHIDDMNK
jgi:very-short-patch-repair endonuclease